MYFLHFYLWELWSPTCKQPRHFALLNLQEILFKSSGKFPTQNYNSHLHLNHDYKSWVMISQRRFWMSWNPFKSGVIERNGAPTIFGEKGRKPKCERSTPFDSVSLKDFHSIFNSISPILRVFPPFSGLSTRQEKIVVPFVPQAIYFT